MIAKVSSSIVLLKTKLCMDISYETKDYYCAVCQIFMQRITYYSYCFTNFLITPHAQRERGEVIGCGVHIYIYMFVNEKNI